MKYEIHFDDTAGVHEAYAVHPDGTYEWIAAGDTPAEAQAWADKHKAGEL